jgi:hypothetical protein
MVKTTDARQRQHRARWVGLRLEPADDRCLFIEPNVRSVLIVITDVLAAKPQEMSLMQRK